MGIEPTPSAWKAEVLPLNYTRLPLSDNSIFYLPGLPVILNLSIAPLHLVEGVGFEPTKAEPTDLQSAPVDRLGTPPKNFKSVIFTQLPAFVNKIFSGGSH